MDNTIESFCCIYNMDKTDVFSDPKIEYRWICYKHLEYIRCYEIPAIEMNKTLEAVLIEYRCFPHVEFTIRNTINKLGVDWSYTVVCGNLNYDFMLSLCLKISDKIKVIKTDYDNLNQSSYSKFIASIEFWDLFIGEKILIYQEDSCIFKKNIADFLEWDYIGAPWIKSYNKNGVGNGGLSLRTKQCMKDVIKTISIEDTIYNESILNNMIISNMYILPEDVYFTLNMLIYDIGRLADWDTASEFSSEYIYNPNSLGGHAFWLGNNNWKDLLYIDDELQL